MEPEIREWLAGGQDYAAGVALYDRFGSSDVLKRMFTGSNNSFARAKLTKALQDLAGQQPATAPDARVTAAPREQSAPAPAPMVKLTEQQEQTIRAQMRPLLDERTALHGRLSVADELGLMKPEIARICRRIKQLTDQVTPLFLQLKHGRAPDPEVDQVDLATLSKDELIQERLRARVQRTKLKKNPKRHGELPAIEAKIQELTNLIIQQ